MPTSQATLVQNETHTAKIAWLELITPTLKLLTRLTHNSVINVADLGDASAHYNDLLDISEDYIFGAQVYDMTPHLMELLRKLTKQNFNQCKTGNECCSCDPLGVMFIPPHQIVQ